MSMKFCPFCGKEQQEDAKFCPSCGASLTGEQAQYAPAQQVYATQKPKVPGRGLGIASMVLGILGLLDSLTLIDYIFDFFGAGYEYYGTQAEFFSENVGYAIFGILGLVFGLVARKRGYKNGISTAGVVTSIISLVLIVAFTVLAIICIDNIIFDNSWYDLGSSSDFFI